jgi:hypothetical protein
VVSATSAANRRFLPFQRAFRGANVRRSSSATKRVSSDRRKLRHHVDKRYRRPFQVALNDCQRRRVRASSPANAPRCVVCCKRSLIALNTRASCGLAQSTFRCRANNRRPQPDRAPHVAVGASVRLSERPENKAGKRKMKKSIWQQRNVHRARFVVAKECASIPHLKTNKKTFRRCAKKSAAHHSPLKRCCETVRRGTRWAVAGWLCITRRSSYTTP